MILYLNENKSKKIFIDESKIHLLRERFDENAEDEGGIYHINDIDGKNMYADYEYLPNDDKIYADYSNYAKKRGLLHRNNPTWFTDSYGETPYKYKDFNSYQKAGKNLGDSDPYSDYITNYGKIYMPTKREIGKSGDRVKEIGELTPDRVNVKNGQTIECYNLSMLGIDPSVATMIAHTYKGKPATYKGDLTDIASSNAHKLVVADKEGNKPNLIKGVYAEKIKKLILNTDGLKPQDFYPTYIIYPESSSPFNDYIAEFLIKNIYPKSELIPNRTLVKTDSWDIDYDELVKGTANEAYSESNSSYRDYYGKYEKLSNLYIKQALFNRLKGIVANKVLKLIPSLREKYYNNAEEIDNGDDYTEDYYVTEAAQNNGFNVFSDMSSNERYYLCSEILDYIIDETKEIDKALMHNGVNLTISRAPYLQEFLLLVYHAIFSRNGRSDSIAYYSKKFNSAKGKSERKNNFRTYQDFESAFINGDLNINMKNLINYLNSNDSIKNYDYVSRMSLYNQFKITDNYDLKKFKKNASFLIIDDNFASGASLRNAAIVLNEVLGIPYDKIKALTPGDMGGASSGGAQGAEVPTNDAEGYLSQLYHKGYFANDNIDKATQDRLKNKYKELRDNQSHKKYFDIRDLQFNILNDKKRQLYGNAPVSNVQDDSLVGGYKQKTIENPNKPRKFNPTKQERGLEELQTIYNSLDAEISNLCSRRSSARNEKELTKINKQLANLKSQRNYYRNKILGMGGVVEPKRRGRMPKEKNTNTLSPKPNNNAKRGRKPYTKQQVIAKAEEYLGIAKKLVDKGKIDDAKSMLKKVDYYKKMAERMQS